jgi:hypothetical protein
MFMGFSSDDFHQMNYDYEFHNSSIFHKCGFLSHLASEHYETLSSIVSRGPVSIGLAGLRARRRRFWGDGISRGRFSLHPLRYSGSPIIMAADLNDVNLDMVAREDLTPRHAAIITARLSKPSEGTRSAPDADAKAGREKTRKSCLSDK